MNKYNLIARKSIFFVFFISGFCGLLYQVVWLRMAYADFGINAQVMSIVVSVFMLGLALGSWVAGRYLIPWSRKINIQSIYLYAFAETGIGLSAFLVPKFFNIGRNWLLTFGSANTFAYLSLSALVIVVSIIPWCFLMGTTIPLIVEFINKRFTKDNNIFSFLYLANTIGAIIGSIASAFILIEIFGLRDTLIVAAALNICIVVTSLIIARYFTKNSLITSEIGSGANQVVPSSPILNWERKIMLPLLFTTGLTSMGLEVVWTRLFTPILSTTVYSFAFILILYLIGTVSGLWCYRYNLKGGQVLSIRHLLLMLFLVSFSQIFINDPRLGFGALGMTISIFAFSFILGYLTPKQIDTISSGNPEIIGTAYAVNIIGCIIGPILTSYLLQPLVGAKYSIVVLCLPFIFFIIYSIKSWPNPRTFLLRFSAILVAIVILIPISTTYEEGFPYPNKRILRDYNATVTAYAHPTDKRQKALHVNGVGMTVMTVITKNMAHMPLAMLRGQASKALVICFGMGTTFRSALSWDIDTTAVELTPSVVKLFPFFFSDAESVMSSPKAHVVIDDGRRYLQRTNDKYDLIAIDPPPPVEAAGSSLLYSKEFYEVIKQRLTEKGILQQWYYEKPGPTLNAVARSLVEVFPYVDVYYSVVDDGGYHFFASNSPIEPITPQDFVKNLPPKALADFMEWAEEDGYGNDPVVYAEKILSRKMDIKEFLSEDRSRVVSDDQPYNEYFLLRSIFGVGNI